MSYSIAVILTSRACLERLYSNYSFDAGVGLVSLIFHCLQRKRGRRKAKDSAKATTAEVDDVLRIPSEDLLKLAWLFGSLPSRVN